MKGKKLFLLVFVVCVLGMWGLAEAQSGSGPATYMDAAARVITENNRIDSEIADVRNNASVSIRPYIVMERLKKINKDTYAIWPALFVKEVPDKYSDLYLNLKKLIKLQMKRTCLLYDMYYYDWMQKGDSAYFHEGYYRDRDKVSQFRKELKDVDCEYFKQKQLVDGIYGNLQKSY